MGHFVRGTVRVELGVHSCGKKEYWVLKKKLSVADRERIAGSVLKVKLGDVSEGKRVDDSANVALALTEMRRVATVGWTLYDDDGQEMPFDPDLIDELDPDDPITELIDNAIAEQNYNPFGAGKGSSPQPSNSTEESSSTDK